jgi:hypothetical protein
LLQDTNPVPGKFRGRLEDGLAGEFPQEFAFIHVVFEGFTAIDENHGDFIGKLAAKILVCIYVYFSPVKAAAPLQLAQALLDDFAEMAAFAGVNDNVARRSHWAILTFPLTVFQDI